MNLGSIYKKSATSIRLLLPPLNPRTQPDNANAHIILGGIYKDLANRSALASTLKSLELKPDNPYAHSG